MINKSNQITINLKSFSLNILKYYLASFSFLVPLKNYTFKMHPTKYKSLTVLRSPHKYKKAQEHFQLKIYKSTLTLTNVTVSNIAALLMNKPKGVFIKFRIRQLINKI